MNAVALSHLNPKTDKHIPFPYNDQTIQQKKKNKFHFLKTKNNIFTLLILNEETSRESKTLLPQLWDACSAIQTIQPILLGHAPSSIPKIPVFHKEDMSNAFATADTLLILPSQVLSAMSLLISAMRYGVVPLVPHVAKIKSIISAFDPVAEKGNGFLYEKETIWHIFETIIRAKENFKFPYDWENLMLSCMKS